VRCQSVDKEVPEPWRQAGAQDHCEPTLKRTLGIFGLTAFGVGGTIGAGIFVLTGTVAATHAGPAVALSFLLASVASLFAGLCYAEFAALAPVAGSAYTYARATLGELTGWLVGWSLMFEYVFSASLIAIGWSAYFNSMLRDAGIILPRALTAAPFEIDQAHRIVMSGAIIDLPAVLVTLLCTFVLMLGTQLSSVVNVIIVIAKVGAILAVIAVGFAYVDFANWHPFIPPNTGTFGEFGWSGVSLGAGIVFFSYLGFDGVSTLAEETKNPKRTVPISMIASLAICTVLYILVSLVITGVASYRSLDVPDPLYFALAQHGASLAWLKVAVGIVAIVGLVSAVLFCLLGQVRIFLAMGRDGLLPPSMAKIHSRFRTPLRATLVTGLMAAGVAGLFPLQTLSELISIGTLLAFVTVCIALLVLRRAAPNLKRPFRTPWVPLIPVLGAVSCLILMASLPAATWVRLGVWLVLGVLFYRLYGYRHSHGREVAVGFSTFEEDKSF
jgi:APA family basic amino acid/polyamine antiporter